MKVSNLQVGRIKNYKVLCELINEPIKTGNGKRAQLKELERYCSYQKNGNSFIITEIYDMPKVKKDNRKIGNNSIYINEIEILLLEYLIGRDSISSQLTLNQLFNQLGMVNAFYNRIEYKDLLQERDSQITSWHLGQFDIDSKKSLKKIFLPSLNNLERRKVIDYEMVLMVVDKDNNVSIAEDEVVKFVLEAQERVLLNMGLPSMQHVFLKRKTYDFYSKVNLEVYEKYGYIKVYSTFNISLGESFAMSSYEEKLMGLDSLELKRSLNAKVVNVLKTSICKKYSKEALKWEEARASTFKHYAENYWIADMDQLSDEDIEGLTKAFKYPDNFIEVQELLVKELIAI